LNELKSFIKTDSKNYEILDEDYLYEYEVDWNNFKNGDYTPEFEFAGNQW